MRQGISIVITLYSLIMFTEFDLRNLAHRRSELCIWFPALKARERMGSLVN
jgi:hypothetical protein